MCRGRGAIVAPGALRAGGCSVRSSHGNQPRRARARPAVHSRNGLQRDRDSRPMGRRRTLPRKVRVRRPGSRGCRRGAVRSPRDRAARPRASGMDPAAVRRWPACSRGSCGGGRPGRRADLLRSSGHQGGLQVVRGRRIRIRLTYRRVVCRRSVRRSTRRVLHVPAHGAAGTAVRLERNAGAGGLPADVGSRRPEADGGRGARRANGQPRANAVDSPDGDRRAAAGRLAHERGRPLLRLDDRRRPLAAGAPCARPRRDGRCGPAARMVDEGRRLDSIRRPEACRVGSRLTRRPDADVRGASRQRNFRRRHQPQPRALRRAGAVTRGGRPPVRSARRRQRESRERTPPCSGGTFPSTSSTPTRSRAPSAPPAIEPSSSRPLSSWRRP